MSARIACPFELSESGNSIWAKSPLGARVRVANINQFTPLNGIDNRATAEFIVKAVNNHDELVASLRVLHEIVLGGMTSDYDFMTKHLGIAGDLLEKVKS